ncbi:olfactory receptor 51A4-like [Marmota marmota marmota]|uniref:Olfactory receptor n=1 Tax=Marmota marmota marmota TaxID=9994 RepID=A0A8C5ZHQ2_MARMA|nr:olfactory receptor 51A4-like [Marmota marmota marmota]XP_027798614.1 olfactory receptor 51A4-like [Marmota flaviventris]
MELTNKSWFQPPTFLLTGIPGLEFVQIWISIPVGFMYLVALLGNCTILFVIKTTSILHEPQYIFLSMLAATDVGLSLSTLPTVLKFFLLNHREIEFHSCLAQMFFIHTFSSMESAILLAMAFDRFVAICDPLHYTVVLTPPRIIGIGLIAVFRGVLLMVPLPILLKRLPFCKGVILSHCYCYHPDVMKLACGSVRVNIVYGLSLVLCSFAIDSIFIVISYILILKTVLGVASGDGQLKALNTCVSHIFTVFIFYVPLIVLALIHRFGTFTSPLLHVTMANLFLFLTPVLNPLVYSLKTKQIRLAMHKILKSKANFM